MLLNSRKQWSRWQQGIGYQSLNARDVDAKSRTKTDILAPKGLSVTVSRTAQLEVECEVGTDL
jgi:hypothetical protein